MKLKEQGKVRWISHQIHREFGLHAKPKLEAEQRLRDAIAAIIQLNKVPFFKIILEKLFLVNYLPIRRTLRGRQ